MAAPFPLISAPALELEADMPAGKTDDVVERIPTRVRLGGALVCQMVLSDVLDSGGVYNGKGEGGDFF